MVSNMISSLISKPFFMYRYILYCVKNKNFTSRISLLSRAIPYTVLLQAEELGCEGKVEEAQGIMKLCDQLNEERTQLQNVCSVMENSFLPDAVIMKNKI